MGLLLVFGVQRGNAPLMTFPCSLGYARVAPRARRTFNGSIMKTIPCAPLIHGQSPINRIFQYIAHHQRKVFDRHVLCSQQATLRYISSTLHGSPHTTLDRNSKNFCKRLFSGSELMERSGEITDLHKYFLGVQGNPTEFNERRNSSRSCTTHNPKPPSSSLVRITINSLEINAATLG